jgi:hypothetical protein
VRSSNDLAFCPRDRERPLKTSNPHQWKNPMSLIQVQVIKDVFSKEQKRQIISKLTDAMVSIEGEKCARSRFA